MANISNYNYFEYISNYYQNIHNRIFDNYNFNANHFDYENIHGKGDHYLDRYNFNHDNNHENDDSDTYRVYDRRDCINHGNCCNILHVCILFTQEKVSHTQNKKYSAIFSFEVLLLFLEPLCKVVQEIK